MITEKFKVPYYAVIFSSIRTNVDEGYEKMNQQIYSEIEKNEGYLGHEGTRQDDRFGINVSYWKDTDSILKWKNNEIHKKAKELGMEKWYEHFRTRICKVEREY